MDSIADDYYPFDGDAFDSVKVGIGNTAPLWMFGFRKEASTMVL